MKWLSYSTPGNRSPRAGLLHEGEVRGLGDAPTLLQLIAAGALSDAGGRATSRPSEVLPLDVVRVHAPVPQPPSIRDFLSFEEHIRNASAAMGVTIDPGWYEHPVFYFSNPAAVRDPGADIPISPGSSRFDYEVEVAAVIGSEGADLAVSDAERHIAGYTVLCDWSARDLQAAERPLGFGPVKGKDGATSLGPLLVTPDELEPLRRGNGYDLAMSADLNGRTMNRGNWSDVHWSFAQMLSYASRGTRLLPGDVLGSGTVGRGCLLELNAGDRDEWLLPGDRVDVTVDELGTLSGIVTEGSDPLPL